MRKDNNLANLSMLKNMILCILIIIILLVFNIDNICAQSNKGSIIGNISPAIQTVTVQLYDPITRKVLLSVNPDQSGGFSFKEITPGNYIVKISFNGFMDRFIAISVKEGTNDVGRQFLETPILFANTFPPTVLSKYPSVSGARIFTVCELLRLEYIQLLQANEVIIIGNMVQTPEGNWMEQSCGNPVKSGAHIWPDAVFLNDDSSPIYVSNHKKFIDYYDSKLKEAIRLVGKNYSPNKDNDNNVTVAVIGHLITSDNLVYVKCGEEKTCGSGYGPIVAPVQINYRHMRHLNQQGADAD